MNILSSNQLKEADSITIQNQQITSWQLMEKASARAVKVITNICNASHPVTILVGCGNNGGDGLAIAYHLYQLGYTVEVIVLKYTQNFSLDCFKNLQRVKKHTSLSVSYCNEINDLKKLKFQPVIIDAIFGIGLNKSLPPMVESIIHKTNQSRSLRIAIDVPSGISLDYSLSSITMVFNAHHTLTFHCPKLQFFLPIYGNDIGKIHVIPIDLDQNYIQGIPKAYIYITIDFVTSFFKTRKRFTHKGSYGHLLVVGGQYGMMGSVCLTTQSALKSGVGKVSVVCPSVGSSILQQSIVEAMVVPSKDAHYISPIKLDFFPDVICIGIGIGTTIKALEALKFYLKYSKKPMLLDADAINLLKKNKSLLKELPAKSILTPHQGELKGLIEDWENDLDKIEKMKQFSVQYDVILVAKDAYTYIVDSQNVYINSSGNAGMATAGSGDVLAGIISGLMAQNYKPLEAAILGVFLHGTSADFYVHQYDEYSLIASDIIYHLKDAFSLIKKHLA